VAALDGATVDEASNPYSISGTKITAIVTPAPEGGFVAYNPETGASSQGETESGALSNIREATELYLEEYPDSIKSQPIAKTFELTLNT
jgi:predicted RNase H-like HicB family nuclease